MDRTGPRSRFISYACLVTYLLLGGVYSFTIRLSDHHGWQRTAVTSIPSGRRPPTLFRRRSAFGGSGIGYAKNDSDDANDGADSFDYADDGITVKNYRHGNNRKLTYLYKAPTRGRREVDLPVVLIHPVGIGISSWFWSKLISSYGDDGSDGSPAIYAPDLIGCGLRHGADPWNPDEEGIFFPLSWVEGVETLIRDVVLPNAKREGCIVIVQGGLAPVGVMLANRNPSAVSGLILTSPPTYRDMVTSVPETELERNYSFLRSPFFGSLAFTVLEKRGVVRFFSDLFLFEGECDEKWLDNAERESLWGRGEAREPVRAFNAGLLQHRSYEEELTSLTQKIVILSGEKDKRKIDREAYATAMKNCVLRTIDGLNVTPWENAKAVIEIIKDFEK